MSGHKTGFASMNAERQRQIASLGGKAAHAKGTAHKFTPEEARAAGRKGGEIVSSDRAHMAAIGSEGGKARGLAAAARRNADRTLTQAESGEKFFPHRPKTGFSTDTFSHA